MKRLPLYCTFSNVKIWMKQSNGTMKSHKVLLTLKFFLFSKNSDSQIISSLTIQIVDNGLERDGRDQEPEFSLCDFK
jgi:hypothetical protein